MFYYHHITEYEIWRNEWFLMKNKPEDESKWNKISDLILNQSDDYLRKSLRLINKDLYHNWEEMSKNLLKGRPRSKLK